MNQIRPFIPLVQNGTMSLEELKCKMRDYRAATKQDFDNYLLHALERDVAEVERLPELGQWQRNIHPDSPLSASDTVKPHKANLLLRNVVSLSSNTCCACSDCF